MDETIQKLVDGMEKAAEALGQTAQHLWPEMVRATFALNIGYLIADMLVLLVVCTVGVLMVVKCWHGADAAYVANQNDEASAYSILCILLAFICVAAVLIVVTTVPFHLQGVFAPEGTTVLNLLRGVK